MNLVKEIQLKYCHFYSREKSLYIAWACFRNAKYCMIYCRCLALLFLIESLLEGSMTIRVKMITY